MAGLPIFFDAGLGAGPLEPVTEALLFPRSAKLVDEKCKVAGGPGGD
jgi:hypothetical protein